VAVGGEPQSIVELHAEDDEDASHGHAVEHAAFDRAGLALGRYVLHLCRVVGVELRLSIEGGDGAYPQHDLPHDSPRTLVLRAVLLLLPLLALVHRHHTRHRHTHENAGDG